MNTVVTSFLSSAVDTQRGYKWKPDASALLPLLGSLDAHAFVIVDESDPLDVPDVTWVCVHPEPNVSPYWRRWVLALDLLRARDDIDFVWLVDATDVEMLNDPFPWMLPDVLYVGSEPVPTNTPWLIELHPSAAPLAHVTYPLFNCGLVGGDRQTVMRFVARMLKHFHPADHTDMGALNVALHCWPGEVVTGSRVHTEFRANERTSSAWWKHK